MKTIIDLRIEMPEMESVTPSELLEDFADSCSGWQFLEEESDYYAQLKGVPACILRYVSDRAEALDLVFSARRPYEHQRLQLMLLDPLPPAGTRTPEECRAVLDAFLQAFPRYLGPNRSRVRLEVVEQEAELASPMA